MNVEHIDFDGTYLNIRKIDLEKIFFTHFFTSAVIYIKGIIIFLKIEDGIYIFWNTITPARFLQWFIGSYITLINVLSEGTYAKIFVSIFVTHVFEYKRHF